MSNLGRVFEGLRATEYEWASRAACKGESVDLFFVNPGEYPWEARRLCANCPVRQECLDYAITNNIQLGIWGGRTPKQRRHLRRL